MERLPTDIIATIGPASSTEEILQSMIENGMSVARLNFSWGTTAEREAQLAALIAAAGATGVHVPVIQDLAGPRHQEAQGHAFDPQAPVLSPKDLADLDFGAAHAIPWVALSYVGRAEDIERLRRELEARHYAARTIAKIERAEALEELEGIIAAADAVMVARGDLGHALPLERVPYAQETVIRAARAAGKPAIVATQMLMSMVTEPEPTRAEVADVTLAVEQGASAVMLSEESAKGAHPAQAVAMMRSVIEEAVRRGTVGPHARL